MSLFTDLQFLHENLLSQQMTKEIRGLRRLMADAFTLDELGTISFELGVNLDDLPGQNKQIKVQEIIYWAERRGLITQLVEILQKWRPNFDWPELAKLNVEDVEAYIREARRKSSQIFSLSEREQLQINLTYWANYIEEQTGIKPDDDLLPPQELSFIDRAQAIKWWIIVGLFLLILSAISLIFLQNNLIYSATSTPTVTLTATQQIVTETPVLTNTQSPSATFTPTSTPSATPTKLIPTNTPVSIQGPVDCDNSTVIVPGIFAQLADAATFSFSGSSDASIFECQGVYDRSNQMPPAVRIKYEEDSSGFAFFSIGLSEGFDASSFSEVCLSVYTNDLAQQFDLRLKDTIGLESGIGITTTTIEQWEEQCVELVGYPGIDLENIEVITLSFNDAFGDVLIWVDDYEFK